MNLLLQMNRQIIPTSMFPFFLTGNIHLIFKWHIRLSFAQFDHKIVPTDSTTFQWGKKLGKLGVAYAFQH